MERSEPTRWRDAFRDLIKTLRETRFFQIAVLTTVMVILASAGMYLAEHRTDIEARGFADSVWWALVTVTTVGYGDVVPKTVIGRVIALGVMISGMFLLSLMTATIASLFVSRKIKEDKGLENIRDKGHIIICGWNENGLSVIHGLRRQLKPRLPVIVLVNELPREEVDSILYHFPDMEFRYVRGNFTKEEILARANVRRAKSAIILADTSGAHTLEKADQRTIFGALAIKSLASKVKTCAELLSPENKEHLRRANVDEVVIRGENNASILAGAASASGLSTFMKMLLDVEEPHQIWRARIPERLVGHTVAELTGHFQGKHSALLLAIVTETEAIRLEDILSQDATAIDTFIKRKFEESGKNFFSTGKGRISVQINPPQDYILTKHDAGIVLGRERPGEGSILGKSIDLVAGSGRGEGK
ncbi:MAG: NAD-binding protein [Thermodesulfobacteriota bacterium]|nr:NAD-binding protein [Thermodesulfobacteriota bacterium]